MNLCKTNSLLPTSDTIAEQIRKENFSTLEDAASLIYTTAYQDGYSEARQDTIRFTIKRMLDHHFDYETIQKALGVSMEEIEKIQKLVND